MLCIVFYVMGIATGVIGIIGFCRWGIRKVAEKEGINETRMMLLDEVNNVINGEGE